MKLAYRCPACGGGVKSAVDILTATEKGIAKLKCPCGKSEMKAERQGDKLTLTVPCLFCREPHRFTLNIHNSALEKDLTLSCPLNGEYPMVFFGEEDYITANLASSELDLMKFLEKNQVKDLSELKPDDTYCDPEMLTNIHFVLSELDAEGKIFCGCDPDEPTHTYEVQPGKGEVRVICSLCGKSATIPCDDSMGSRAFLDADKLELV